MFSFLNHSCVPNIAQSHKVVQNGNKNKASENDEDYICRYFLDLRVQRPVTSGTELTIRYNSVFDVSIFLALFISSIVYCSATASLVLKITQINFR